jgi:hypothetical protein
MPWFVAALPWIIPAATAATTTGLQLAGTFSPSSNLKQQQDSLRQQQLHTQQQDQLTKQEAFKAAAPGLQGQVGGDLTQESFSQMVASLTGNPGSLGEAQRTLYSGGGASGGGAPGLTGEGVFSGVSPSSGPSGGGLTDAIRRLFNSGESNAEPSLA